MKGAFFCLFFVALMLFLFSIPNYLYYKETIEELKNVENRLDSLSSRCDSLQNELVLLNCYFYD